MRTKDQQLAALIDNALTRFHDDVKPLPGIQPMDNRLSFIEQVIESVRRVKFAVNLSDLDHSPYRMDPNSEMFDPLRAAVIHKNNGNIEEAFWLVFLFTHFGKNLKTGWRLLRDIYRGYGTSPTWSWSLVSSNPVDFQNWLSVTYPLMTIDGVKRSFGNHRKYETLRPTSNRGTGRVVASYVNWIGESHSHIEFINEVRKSLDYDDPKILFRALYQSMNAVVSFGRTAKFDYLTMLGKLGLAPIEADSAYIVGATGPVRGARLLFGGTVSAKIAEKNLDQLLIDLDRYLNVGMQVLEDSLCNWQKSPNRFIRFRG